MPAKIVRQLVAAGDRLQRGAPLLVLEAMKMEHTIVAPSDGRVLATALRRKRTGGGGSGPLDFEEDGHEAGEKTHAAER